MNVRVAGTDVKCFPYHPSRLRTSASPLGRWTLPAIPGAVSSWAKIRTPALQKATVNAPETPSRIRPRRVIQTDRSQLVGTCGLEAEDQFDGQGVLSLAQRLQYQRTAAFGSESQTPATQASSSHLKSLSNRARGLAECESQPITPCRHIFLQANTGKLLCPLMPGILFALFDEVNVI